MYSNNVKQLLKEIEKARSEGNSNGYIFLLSLLQEVLDKETKGQSHFIYVYTEVAIYSSFIESL